MQEMPQILTPEEVATYLRVAPETVRRLCRLGQIPALKLGRQWRIKADELETYLRQRHKEPEADADSGQSQDVIGVILVHRDPDEP